MAGGLVCLDAVLFQLAGEDGVRVFELGSAQLPLALLELRLVVVFYLVEDDVLGLFYVDLRAY